MDTPVTAIEQQPAEQDTSALTLDSKEGIIQGLKDLLKDPKIKPTEKLRVLDKIAELKGFKINAATFKDLRQVETRELELLVRDYCLPMLAPFGVANGTPSLILEEDSDS